MGFIGKAFVILQHVFSYEKGRKDGEGNSGLLYIVLILFVGFVIWAYTAKFDQGYHGRRQSVPFFRLQEIEHYEGGLLEKIHVKEGSLSARINFWYL